MPYVYWGFIFVGGLLIVAALKADYQARVLLTVALVAGLVFYKMMSKRR